MNCNNDLQGAPKNVSLQAMI